MGIMNVHHLLYYNNLGILGSLPSWGSVPTSSSSSPSSPFPGPGSFLTLVTSLSSTISFSFRASNSEALELRNAEKTDDKEDDTEDTSDAAVEVEGERLEQETVEKAEEMAVPQAPSQSVGNKLKWFFIRFVFKVILV